MTDFSVRILAWHARHGRHELPWQRPRTPYRVWLAEIMLQQTQVATVIPYYQRFLDALPDMPKLAAASLDQVLGLWSGLGYYSRARNLHRAAQLCMARHGGTLPDHMEALRALPGIGRSTAAAILAQAHGQRQAILDGNVRRLLARWSGEPEWPGSSAAQTRLWALSEALLPETQLPDYTQALMDLGAGPCRPREPQCHACPIQSDCQALAEGVTRSLPIAKPRKPPAERERHFLMARSADGRLLLTRRPPQGIWGGLWCLPEYPDAGALDDTVRLRYGAGPIRAPEHDFRHTFTHFRLCARLWRIDGIDSADRIGESDQALLKPDEALSRGLPAPIRTLVEAIRP